jgi:hypothetical protein
LRKESELKAIFSEDILGRFWDEFYWIFAALYLPRDS